MPAIDLSAGSVTTKIMCCSHIAAVHHMLLCLRLRLDSPCRITEAQNPPAVLQSRAGGVCAIPAHRPHLPAA